jgi:hypothetical protein
MMVPLEDRFGGEESEAGCSASLGTEIIGQQTEDVQVYLYIVKIDIL